MIGLASRIRRASQEWEPAVEAAIFGTVDPDEIEKMIVGFVAEHLGSVEQAVFYRPGVGVVAGLRLVGGAEVVIKVHRWNVSVDRLAAVQLVQAHMAARGLPAPRPLAAPEPLGHGIATVEEMALGGSVDGHKPSVRRAAALGLRRFIVAGIEIATPAALGPPLMMRPAERGTVVRTSRRALRFSRHLLRGGMDRRAGGPGPQPSRCGDRAARGGSFRLAG